MEVNVDVEGIAKNAADEAARITTEEAARVAAEEADKRSAEEATKVASDEAAKATGGTSALGAPSAGADVDMGAADNTVPAASNQASTPETPLTKNFLMFLDPQPNPEAPSSSGARALETVEDEVIVPMSKSTEDVHATNDDTADLAFFKAMGDGFKEVQERYSRRWEKLQTRGK
jgi:hypothetical protein